MNSNKKLAKKLFPAVLAAAITLSGVTVPVKAGTADSVNTLKQIGVVAEAVAIVKEDITFTNKEFTYTGQQQGPQDTDIVVKKGEKTLVKDTDYTIESLEKKTDAGKYEITVKGKGNDYNGTVTLEWKINPKETTFKLKDGVTVQDKEYEANSTDAALGGAVVEFEDETVKGLGVVVTTDYTLVANFSDDKIGSGKDVTVKLNPVSGQKLKNYTFKPVMLKGNIVKKKVDNPQAPTGKVAIDNNLPFEFLQYIVTEPADANNVKYQYSKDKAENWQDSNVFGNIKVDEEHDFFIRKKETETTAASEAVKTANKVKFSKVDNDQNPKLDYKLTESGEDKILTINKPTDIPAGYDVEYSFNTDENNQWGKVKTHTYKKTDVVNALKIGIRYAATKTQNASAGTKEQVDLSKVIAGEGPVFKVTKVENNDKTKFKLNIEFTLDPKNEKTYNFAWADQDNQTIANLKAAEFDPGKKVRIYAWVVDGDKKGAKGYVDEAFELIPRTDKIVPEMQVKAEPDTAHQGKKKITVTFGNIPDHETVEYKYDNGSYADYNKNDPKPIIKDNIGQATITVYARYKAKGVYAPSKEVLKYIVLDPVNAPKGFNPDTAAANSTAVKKDDTKKDETKKPEDKKDTKKDETKKPEDKKDNTNTDNKTPAPADTSKAIKDAVKKSTKTGSVTLKSVGSGLEKAVGGNTSKLSVSLNTSKTKSTSKAVTKKLGKSKLVTKTVYSFNIKNGSKNLTDKQVSGSKINVTLKVSLGEKNRTVYVMDVSTGKKVKAKYNAKTEKLTFTTKYVGDFVIVK